MQSSRPVPEEEGGTLEGLAPASDELGEGAAWAADVMSPRCGNRHSEVHKLARRHSEAVIVVTPLKHNQGLSR